MSRTPIVLSWGMGQESTAALVRWIREPASCDFDLGDLVVVTAHTGSEYQRTEDLRNRHVVSLLRQAGVRLVQAANPASNQDTWCWTIPALRNGW